jgi:hypothetical protein
VSQGQPPVQAIVRVRLAPRLPIQAFERWLRACRRVQHAVLVTGDADYELRLECSSFADLGDSLTRVCGYPGVEIVSTGLVLHEVTGLGRRTPERRLANARANSHGCGTEVTLPRQRTM